MINSITNRYKIDLIILLSIFVYIKKSNLFILLCEKKNESRSRNMFI